MLLSLLYRLSFKDEMSNASCCSTLNTQSLGIGLTEYKPLSFGAAEFLALIKPMHSADEFPSSCFHLIHTNHSGHDTPPFSSKEGPSIHPLCTLSQKAKAPFSDITARFIACRNCRAEEIIHSLRQLLSHTANSRSIRLQLRSNR